VHTRTSVPGRLHRIFHIVTTVAEKLTSAAMQTATESAVQTDPAESRESTAETAAK